MKNMGYGGKVRSTEGKLKKERAMAMATKKAAMPMKQTNPKPNQLIAKSMRETTISKLPNKKTIKTKIKMF